MSDELPEWPEDSPTGDEEPIDTKAPITERLAEMLHRALNDRPDDIGPQVVTKWVVVAEVQGVNRDSPTLRWIDSDLSGWEVKGLLTEVMDDIRESRILFSIATMTHDEGEDA
jgi:hypothetical protein